MDRATAVRPASFIAATSECGIRDRICTLIGNCREGNVNYDGTGHKDYKTTVVVGYLRQRDQHVQLIRQREGAEAYQIASQTGRLQGGRRRPRRDSIRQHSRDAGHAQ